MSDTSAPAIFANTILASWGGGQVPTMQNLGAVDQPRRMRPHCKSRRGCVACKRRKVKCDERLPCSSCVKRKVQCLQPEDVIASRLSKSSPYFQIDLHPQISLLHLELFHHWDKQTQSTLAFLEIWPVVTQRAFDEEFVMAAILCIAAMHLATLCPQSTKYSNASLELIAKTVRLFRSSLSRPFTKDNCEAMMGAALLVNYISWCDLGFLDDMRAAGPAASKPHFAQDQLFLLSPGIIHVWSQTVPIFIEKGSVFVQVARQHPRLRIEDALVGRGEDPARFVEPFMEIWDDPRYQTCGSTASEAAVTGPTFQSWHLLLGMETELLKGRSLPCSSAPGGPDDKKQLVHLKEAFIKLTTEYTLINHQDTPTTPASQLVRSSFEGVVRRFSPLLCCEALASSSKAAVHFSTIPSEVHIEQLVYGFPNVCCGPFAELMRKGDSRALVFLYHFYRCARILLDSRRCWWAYARSCAMEELMLEELKSRGLGVLLIE